MWKQTKEIVEKMPHLTTM